MTEQPFLPETTRDEADEGWGELPSSGADDERILRGRPPHHGG